MFATEHITASLSGLLLEKDDQENTTRAGSRLVEKFKTLSNLQKSLLDFQLINLHISSSPSPISLLNTTRAGSRSSRYVVEEADGTRRRRDMEIDELEIFSSSSPESEAVMCSVANMRPPLRVSSTGSST
jgi:SCY1-like protein 2